MSVLQEQRRSQKELAELAESGAARLGEHAATEDVIEWVAVNFSVDAVAVACSMADAVLPALVAQRLPAVDVLFLETGYHFSQTQATKRETTQRLNITLKELSPRQSVAEQDVEFGKDLFARDPAQCCAIRKMAPLKAALRQYELWFTGVRREEAVTRTAAPLISFDWAHQLIKVNPLADWTLSQVLDFAQAQNLPINPLVDEGYLSIGCAPCTRAVKPGEDARAGRWAGQDKIECGIHQ